MSKIIVVDKSKYQLVVIDPGNGTQDPKRLRVCPCAIGMEGFRTPSDEYKTGPRSRAPDWQAPQWAEPPLTAGEIYKFGTLYNPYQHGLISLRALDEQGKPRTGYALHGTKNEASIPGAASHGCIRLKRADILWLYEHIADNTLVIIR